jgi:hypothetical protein
MDPLAGHARIRAVASSRVFLISVSIFATLASPAGCSFGSNGPSTESHDVVQRHLALDCPNSPEICLAVTRWVRSITSSPATGYAAATARRSRTETDTASSFGQRQRESRNGRQADRAGGPSVGSPQRGSSPTDRGCVSGGSREGSSSTSSPARSRAARRRDRVSSRRSWARVDLSHHRGWTSGARPGES